MTTREDYAVVAGVVLCLAGVVLVFVPGLGSAGVPTLLAAALAIAVLLTALVVGLGYLADVTDADVSLPTPERRPVYGRLGSSFGDALDAVGTVGRRRLGDGDDDTPRERLRERLEPLAVAVLTRTSGCTPEAARERLQEGSWTDDEAAAAFFAGGLLPPLSVADRLPYPRTEPPVRGRARRAVAALAATAGFDRPEPDAAGDAPPAESSYWPTDDLPTTRSTGRRKQAVVVVLLVGGFGAFAGSPGLLLVGTFGIAVAAAAQFAAPSASLSVTRRLEATEPDPGETVRVTMTVRNDGDRTVPDLRLLDGVPAGLSVVEDAPRCATALRPGKATTFSYAIEAVPGRHDFEPALAVVGDFVGATEFVDAVIVDGDGTVDCGFDAADPPEPAPVEQTTAYPGLVDSDATGAGVEFDTIREYRPGDPPGRIAWRRRAMTGDLATVEFVEPRRPKVVLVVDARPAAYVASDADAVPAPREAARAAHEVDAGLLAHTRPVGLATLGTETWVPPRGGADQRARLRRALVGDEAVPWTPPEGIDEDGERLLARLDSDADVVVFSPLADAESVRLCRRLSAAGHGVTVVSPDCTASGSVVGAYGTLRRWERRGELRSAGVTVHDWDPATPLSGVLGRD